MRAKQFVKPVSKITQDFLTMAATAGVKTNLPAFAMDRIQRAASMIYGVTKEDLLTKRRWEPLASARMAVFFVAHHQGMTDAEINRELHVERTAAYHTLKSAIDRMETDSLFASKVTLIETLLEDRKTLNP